MAKERPLIAAVIYNRLQERHAARHRRDDPLRHAQLDEPAQAVRADDRLAVQHAPAHRPAADADRQPGPGLDQGRREPGERSSTCSTSSSRARAASTTSRRPTRSSSATSSAYNDAREEAGGNSPTTLAERREAPRSASASSAGRSPTAGRPRCTRRPTPRSGSTGWRYQRLPVPPELFAETVRALPAAGFAGANVTIPHKEAALALADEATDAAREIGAANTLTFAPTARSTPTTPTRPACSPRCDRRPAGRSALVLGAGGSARAAIWALPRRRGGGRRAQPHARARRGPRRARAGRARAGGHARQLHERRPRRPGRAPGGPVRATGSWSTSSTATAAPSCAAARAAAGRAHGRRPGDPRPAGRAQLRAVERAGPRRSRPCAAVRQAVLRNSAIRCR